MCDMFFLYSLRMDMECILIMNASLGLPSTTHNLIMYILTFYPMKLFYWYMYI